MAKPAYTDDIADAICDRLVSGESLRSICRDPKMPNPAMVFRWLADERYASFRDQYERAREVQADTLADELLDIADDGTNDWMERQSKEGESGGYEINGEHIARSRLRVDTRKWIASKLKPKKYGDRSSVDLNVSADTELRKALMGLADD